VEYKYQRARTSRVGLVRENQDALCLPISTSGTTPATALLSMLSVWMIEVGEATIAFVLQWSEFARNADGGSENGSTQ
jgi:hypothetical protein